MKKNGNENLLTKQQEEMRLTVIEMEMKARYWKSHFEVKYYTIENTKLDEEYLRVIEEQKKKQGEQFEQFQEQLDKMRETEGVEVTEGQEEELQDA